MLVKEIKSGFEKEVELLLQKKEALEKEKEAAISEAVAKVEEEFSERENTIISILKLVTVEVEVPDTEEEAEEIKANSTESEGLTEQPAEEVKPSVSEALSPSQLKFGQ